MVRKSNTRRKGAAGGADVQKHKIRAKSNNESSFGEVLLSTFISHAQLERIAQHCFVYMSRACSKLHLFPFETVGMTTNELKFKPCKSRRRKYIHRALILLWIVVFGWRAYETVLRLVRKELDLFTYMAICYVLISGATFVGVAGTTIRADYMVSLLNAGQPLLRSIADSLPRTDERMLVSFSPSYSYPQKTHICFKIILATIVAHVTCINASFFSLAFDTLPVCLFPLMQAFGVLGDKIPSIMWRLLLYPLELFTLLPGMYIIMYNATIIVVAFEFLQRAAEMSGQVSIRDEETWRRVEHCYKYVQLYAKHTNASMLYMVGPLIFSACSATVVLLYVTFRPATLPFIIHCWFPVAAILILVALMWICYDCVIIRRLCEGIADTLGRKCKMYYCSEGLRLCPPVRRELIRRSKALRIVPLVVGMFGEVTLFVIANMWEEILNQLLFLLTL